MEGNLLAPTNGRLCSFGNAQVNHASEFPSSGATTINFGNTEGGDTDDTHLEEKALIYRIQRDSLRLNQIRTQRLFATGSTSSSNQSEDMAIKKQFLRAQDIILRNMLRTMETCKALGFVYGLISKEGKVVTGSSENLRNWWQKNVHFHQTGPIAVADFYSSLSTASSSTDKPEINIKEKLQEISDSTLGSLLSALMPHCVPPQRYNPIEKGIPPCWWPTTNEPWWTELGFPSDIGQPPYKKPRDLRKIWKTAVLIAVIKNISPDTYKICSIINRYKVLQDKITAKELQSWSSVLEQVDREYLKKNPSHNNSNVNENTLLNNGGACIAPTDNAQIPTKSQITMNQTWSFNQDVSFIGHQNVSTDFSRLNLNSMQNTRMQGLQDILSQGQTSINVGTENTWRPSLQDIQQQLNNGFLNQGYTTGNLDGSSNAIHHQCFLDFPHQGNITNGGYYYPEISNSNMGICNNFDEQSAPSDDMQFTKFDSLDDFLRMK